MLGVPVASVGCRGGQDSVEKKSLLLHVETESKKEISLHASEISLLH